MSATDAKVPSTETARTLEEIVHGLDRLRETLAGCARRSDPRMLWETGEVLHQLSQRLEGS